MYPHLTLPLVLGLFKYTITLTGSESNAFKTVITLAEEFEKNFSTFPSTSEKLKHAVADVVYD